MRESNPADSQPSLSYPVWVSKPKTSYANRTINEMTGKGWGGEG